MSGEEGHEVIEGRSEVNRPLNKFRNITACKIHFVLHVCSIIILILMMIITSPWYLSTTILSVKMTILIHLTSMYVKALTIHNKHLMINITHIYGTC